jgi:flagellar FliL protein
MAKKQPDEEGAAADAAPKKSKLKLIIILAVLLLAGGGGAGWFFFLRHPAHDQHAEAPPPKPPAFVDVPEMMVNLAGQPGERVQYLKVKIVLEVKDALQVPKIQPAMPRVTDIFQTYLRELRASDLNGSAGLFRLKEEMTRRVNAAVAPSEVAAVLFKEVVIQ